MITSPTFTFQSMSMSLKEKGLGLCFPMQGIVTKLKGAAGMSLGVWN